MELPLASPNIFIFDYVFPAFIGPDVMRPTVVEGTAFGIGDGRFVTAAHCLREGVKSGWMALGTTDGKQVRAWDISAWELVDDYDLAVFHADVAVPVKCFPWARGSIAHDDHCQGCGISVRNRTRAQSYGHPILRRTRCERHDVRSAGA